LIPAWRLVLSLASGIYGCINLYHVWIKRRTVKSILDCSMRDQDYSRYFRLFMLGGVDVLITIPLNIWCFTTWFPVDSWQSWATIHAKVSHIEVYRDASWRENHTLRLTLDGTRWISVVYAYIFFLFFGFTDEARGHYAFVLKYIAAKKAGFRSGSSHSSESRIPELGVTTIAHSRSFDSDSKHESESESEFPPLPDLKDPSTTTPQLRIMRTPSLPVP